MASSTPAAAAHGEEGAKMMMRASGAVCCMCGDQGLADELFRCRCCRARLQHRYCSDLYPRAAVYRRCNWCLRAPAPAPDQGGRTAAAAVATENKKSPEEKRKTTAPASAASDEERRHQRQEGWRSPRRRSQSPPFSELLGHHPPVKKKHRAEQEKTPQPAAAAAGKKEVVSTGAAAGGSNAEVMRAGTKARMNRVRPRRYKLLTEVISC